jgi:hypothetical protein
VKALLAKKVIRGEIWPKLAAKFKLSDSYARLCVYKWFPTGSKSHAKRSKMRKGFKIGWDKARKATETKVATKGKPTPKKPLAAKKVTPPKTAKVAPKVTKTATKTATKAPVKSSTKGLLARATKVNAEKPKSFMAQAQTEVMNRAAEGLATKKPVQKVAKPKPAPKPTVAASSTPASDTGVEYGRTGD